RSAACLRAPAPGRRRRGRLATRQQSWRLLESEGEGTEIASRPRRRGQLRRSQEENRVRLQDRQIRRIDPVAARGDEDRRPFRRAPGQVVARQLLAVGGLDLRPGERELDLVDALSRL